MPIIGDRPEINLNAVVYATDFSSCSENAGNYARLIAGYFSARLFVAHAFLLSQAAQEVESRRSGSSQQRVDLDASLTQRVSELSKARLQAQPVLLDGNPHEVIPAFAEKNAPSVTLLGTHGAGRFAHGLLGSTAEKILRSSRWPCFTVGPQAPIPPEDSLPFHRILWATDFTPAAANAAVYALTFAEAAAGDIDTLNVIPQNAVGQPEQLANLESHYRRALDQVVPNQARDFCSPHTYVEVGAAHDRILQHIRERQIDLLVLGIRKTSHVGFAMRTSGAFRIIAEASCPVLTITG